MTKRFQLTFRTSPVDYPRISVGAKSAERPGCRFGTAARASPLDRKDERQRRHAGPGAEDFVTIRIVRTPHGPC
jgi:hypothetical protein